MENNSNNTLVQISDWQKIESKGNIKIIYGQTNTLKAPEYKIDKQETIEKQISIITKIIRENNIKNVEIYDINNAIAIIEVCNNLGIEYIINIAYPINWVTDLAKYYCKYTRLNLQVKINYNQKEYKKQYEKIFNVKNTDTIEIEKINEIKNIIDKYEIQLCGTRNRMQEIQEFASYLQNELNIYKNSKVVKIALKISAIVKKIRSIRVISRVNKIVRYIREYGVIRSVKKIIYKISKNKDFPLWEDCSNPHYKDLYEFKFIRYKNEFNKNKSINVQKIKTQYKKNLVSIILPVYNGEDLLREALESIKKQTYVNFECIMVNDGSTDNSLNIMKEFAKNDSRFRIINQENSKLPKALNNGFREAKGEFYTWTSCDNNMDPQFIEKMVKQLKQDKTVDFIYADLKLIDENGDILKGFGWYEIPENSGNVILPNNINHLNTYPNNYIGAAFMYRSIVHKILSDYSENRYTVEDYDYWQRINSLLKIKKARFSRPLYYYRFHSKSLTAQTKELAINEKRDKMMIYDDFRRDYYLIPFCWMLDSKYKKNKVYKKIYKYLKKNDQVILEDSSNENEFSMNYSNVVYINFDGKEDKNNNFFAVNVKNKKLKYQISYCHKNGKECKLVSDFKNIMKTIEIIAKDYYTIKYENKIFHQDKNEKEISVVICTYNRNEQLEKAIKSVIDQTANKEKYEIIVVNNNIEETQVKEVVNRFREQYKLEESFLRYYVAPIKGLSYARNVGMWEAKGKYILYIDDDSICDNNIISVTEEAFRKNPKAGVVGGNIILRVPEEAEKVYLPEHADMWSQYIVKGKEYSKIETWYDYPYGANFAINKEDLLQIGGFRYAYGRKKNDFSGGEEIITSALIRKLNKDIIVARESRVIHAVDTTRFSEEHIKNTYRNGTLTWYRLYLDLYIEEEITYADIQYKLKLIENKEKDKEKLSKKESFYLESEKEANYKLTEYFYEIEKMRGN